MKEKINNSSKKKTKIEQVVELYSSGENNLQVIAEKTGTKLETVKVYLRRARKVGRIEGKPKTKSKKEQVIELYNNGEKDPHVLAKKVGSTAETVTSYLSIARREGKVEKTKTKKEQVIELYNNGEKNPQVLAEKVGSTAETVTFYLSIARREGKIEKITKDKTKIEQVIELYKAGEKDRQIIAEKVGITAKAVDKHISRARKEGKIERKPKTKKEQIIELYNAGEKNPQVLAEKVGSTVKAVNTYLSIARKEGRIEKKKSSEVQEGIKDKTKKEQIKMKNKTKKEQVIELYSAGEKSLKVLSEKTGVTVRSVSTFLYEARKEGKIEKAKTRVEQISELYNSGYRDVRSLAEILGVEVEVASMYLNKAEKMGKIEKRLKDKTKIEQVIELYNDGEKNLKIIAERVGSTVKAVSNYLNKARIAGRIERKPKTKSKKEQVIKLYKAGEKDKQIIAKKVGCKVGTVRAYLNQERKEGRIERIKTKQEQALELYKEGERNTKIIAEKVGVSIETVDNYLRKAEKMGIIEGRPKTETKKKQIIELYKAGEISPKIIAEKLGIKEETVNGCLTAARKEGIIERRPKTKTKKEKVIELYNSGEKDPEIIAEKVDTTRGTVTGYLNMARKEGKIKNQEEENPVEDTLKDKVKILLETKYPSEIAEQLNIPQRNVYDVIDSLNRNDIYSLKVKIVKNNPLYPIIAYLRKTKKLSIENALYILAKSNLSLENKINLAKIYFALGNENAPEILLNEVISNEKATSEIINIARKERDKMLLEIKSRKIREDYKKETNDEPYI